MKVLITGGAGEVGKYLTSHLVDCGHEIKILDLPAKAPEMNKDPRITFTHGNLMDAESINNAVRGVDIVIHLAWSFLMIRSRLWGRHKGTRQSTGGCFFLQGEPFHIRKYCNGLRPCSRPSCN